MDKLQHYQQIIRQILSEQAHPYAHSQDVETQIICDTEHDQSPFKRQFSGYAVT
jgi:hypothetical protein